MKINNIELELTDFATNSSTVFKCSYYVSNNSPSWWIVADDIEECKKYMIENFECVEDPNNAETEEERELLESYFSIEEYADINEFLKSECGIDQANTDIADYMIDHGGDNIAIPEYLELIEAINNQEYIEGFDLCREFRLIHEDDIWDIYVDYIEELTKDCYLHGNELPDFLAIDWEQTAENCSADGYGHSFSGYDGSEELLHGVYIFCVN